MASPCCGATNPPCDSVPPPMTLSGCERCGHSKGCHYLPTGMLGRYATVKEGTATVDMADVVPQGARGMTEAVVYDTLMGDRDGEDADTFDLARRIVHDLIESDIRLDADVVPPERHNHDPIGLYANCPACGTVSD